MSQDPIQNMWAELNTRVYVRQPRTYNVQQLRHVLIQEWNNNLRKISRRYRKVPNFSDARKLCCNLSKIQTEGANLRVFHRKDAKGIANSEDPDQTAPLGAV